LIARYHQEAAANPEVQNIIAALQHYLSQADDQKVLGLEAKLSAAGRQKDILRASRMKEMFAKKLERHFFSESAQHIYAFILSRIYQLFKVEVRPLLLAEVGQSIVDRAVLEKVLQPVFAELEDNVLLVNYDELEGMLYFLTGNCHLAWDGSC
jgi:hypothetical protein